MLDAHELQVWVFAGQDWLVRDPNGSYLGLEEHTVGFRPTIVKDFGPSLDVAAKLVGVSKDFELLARCERDGYATLADQASVARSQPYYLDLTHPLANKGVALSELATLWLFRLRRSPSSAMAAMMSRYSSRVVLALQWAMPVRRCGGLRIS